MDFFVQRNVCAGETTVRGIWTMEVELCSENKQKIHSEAWLERKAAVTKCRKTENEEAVL